MRGLVWLLALAMCGAPAQAGAPHRQWVAPHATDERLAADDAPHLLIYDTEPEAGPSLLLVWLPGTNGHPSTGPQRFFDAAVRQGYRVLALSYPTSPAVSQTCVGPRLRTHPDCAEQFRQQRVWGDRETSLIPDRAEDAIVPRLLRLLRHLAATDPAGQWGQYLDAGEPRWDRIVLAGQSQGGGMAAFLAQMRSVAGVLMFSGGWDRGPGDKIARWYRRESRTPTQRWHATFHVEEANAATMAQISSALGLPADHVHALSLPVQGRGAHTEGISNAGYLPLWLQMLGALAGTAR